eukprot:g5781.t1
MKQNQTEKEKGGGCAAGGHDEMQQAKKSAAPATANVSDESGAPPPREEPEPGRSGKDNEADAGRMTSVCAGVAAGDREADDLAVHENGRISKVPDVDADLAGAESRCKGANQQDTPSTSSSAAGTTPPTGQGEGKQEHVGEKQHEDEAEGAGAFVSPEELEFQFGRPGEEPRMKIVSNEVSYFKADDVNRVTGEPAVVDDAEDVCVAAGDDHEQLPEQQSEGVRHDVGDAKIETKSTEQVEAGPSQAQAAEPIAERHHQSADAEHPDAEAGAGPRGASDVGRAGGNASQAQNEQAGSQKATKVPISIAQIAVDSRSEDEAADHAKDEDYKKRNKTTRIDAPGDPGSSPSMKKKSAAGMADNGIHQRKTVQEAANLICDCVEMHGVDSIGDIVTLLKLKTGKL